MPPVGLLAIVALGMVLAYVLPQRIRERDDYAMVRVEDRYSADMRVIRSSAQRAIAAERVAPGATNDGAPLLVTGPARASVVALGEATMSRPSAPLDRAAMVASREAASMRRDRSQILAARARRARRRGVIATLALVGGVAGWAAVPLVEGFTVWPAVAATTAFGAVTVAGRRTVRAQADLDERLVPVAREVMTAAAATSALQRIAVSRAAGRPMAPSFAETEAIRVLTTKDLAPGAVPASVPAPDLPVEGEEGWTPAVVPPPAYTLKATAAQRTPRPISEDDLAAAAAAVERAAETRDGAAGRRRRAVAEEAAPSTAALDAILARRRRETA